MNVRRYNNIDVKVQAYYMIYFLFPQMSRVTQKGPLA